MMNSIRITDCVMELPPFHLSCLRYECDWKSNFNLRDSLLGVGIAMISGALPFAVWNLKGYLDTIPHELEEAAIDGANPIRSSR